MSKWRARAKHFVAEGGPKESLATSATSTDRPINALGMECEGNHPRRERFGFAPCKREVWSGRDGGDHPKTIAYLRTLKTPTVALMMILLMVATVILKWIVLNPLQDFPLHSKRPSAQQKKENSIKLEFHSYQGGTKPLHIHASSNGKIRIRTPEAKQLIHEGQGRVPEKAGVDITIVGFTNISMLNFALNWLWHLEKTIGKRQVSDRLLLYVVGDNTKAALLKSGLIPEHCIRDGTIGSVDLNSTSMGPMAFSYASTGFNKLAAQRPRILDAAIQERKGLSKAVLYSDMDAVWRQNPLPKLRLLLNHYDVVGARDKMQICTGFLMLSTRQKQVRIMLRKWEESMTQKNVVNQHVFNEEIKKSNLKVGKLPSWLFPSGFEFFEKRKYRATSLVVHANFMVGDIKKQKALLTAGLWNTTLVSELSPEPIETTEVFASDISIVSVVNATMAEHAINWLRNLNLAIGEQQVSSSLVLYAKGKYVYHMLRKSAVIPNHCIRFLGGGKSSSHVSRVIRGVLEERAGVSKAVIYSDVAVIWRQDPLPYLRELLDASRSDLYFLQESEQVHPSFIVFTRSNESMALLSSWVSVSPVDDQQWFTTEIQMRKELSVKLLPADLFASMAGILGNKIYESTVKVIRVPGSPSVMRQQVVAAKLFRLSKAEKIAAQKVMQHRNRNRVSARKDGNWTTHAQDD